MAGNVTLCLILLAFSAATDFFDGYLARRLKVTSRLGGYYDATADFVLMFGIYVIFSFKAYYPIWLLILISALFIHF